MRKTITVLLEEEKIKEMKKLCVDEGRTLTDFIDEATDKLLEKSRSKEVK